MMDEERFTLYKYAPLQSGKVWCDIIDSSGEFKKLKSIIEDQAEFICNALNGIKVSRECAEWCKGRARRDQHPLLSENDKSDGKRFEAELKAAIGGNNG